MYFTDPPRNDTDTAAGHIRDADADRRRSAESLERSEGSAEQHGALGSGLQFFQGTAKPPVFLVLPSWPLRGDDAC